MVFGEDEAEGEEADPEAEAMSMGLVVQLHQDYPFLDPNRCEPRVEPSGDAHADTLKEARGWLDEPWLARYVELLSAFVLVDVVAHCGLLVYAVATIERELGHTVAIFGGASYTGGFSAVGSFCIWIGLMRYFMHSRRLQLVATTLTHAVTPIVWTMVSVSPVFLGYAFAGMQLFGAYAPDFASIGVACSTLWALMVGDEVNQTFRTVTAEYPYLGRFFLCSYLGLFYITVANIFIALVDYAHVISLQAIFNVKRESRSSPSRWSLLGKNFSKFVSRVVGNRSGVSGGLAGPTPGMGIGGGDGGGDGGGGGGGGALEASAESAARLQQIEATLRLQGELLQQLIARLPPSAGPGAPPRPAHGPRPAAVPGGPGRVG